MPAYNLKAEAKTENNVISTSKAESYQGFTADLENGSVIRFTNYLSDSELDEVTYTFVKGDSRPDPVIVFGAVVANHGLWTC